MVLFQRDEQRRLLRHFGLPEVAEDDGRRGDPVFVAKRRLPCKQSPVFSEGFSCAHRSIRLDPLRDEGISLATGPSLAAY